ncbi:MAG TPA: hypothetical protein DCP06_00705 [Lachnospiraceae bacterium]|nr:hypothetical protein [Lachnospiraceae bacterium]
MVGKKSVRFKLCDQKSSAKAGFSLIEMIIAIAIVGIVMSSVILLISYSTNSMRRTSNSVELQNQVKDGVQHMTTHLQEGSDAYWDDVKKALIVAKRIKANDGSTVGLDVDHYWRREETPLSGTDDRGLVFIKDVKSFECDVKDNRYQLATADPAASVTPAASVAPAGSATPAASPGASPTGSDERYVICYCKRHYADASAYITDTGAINFAALALDYTTVTSDDNTDITSTAAPATPNPAATTAPTPDPAATLAPLSSADPTATPFAIKVGAKYVVISIDLENETGDAKFTSVKEVYMRNQ